jgi:hypothetical protein
VDSPDVVVELIDEFVSQSSRDALVPAA